MGGLKGIKISIDEKDFYREFRSRVRDPLVESLTGRSDNVALTLKELLEEELPKFLFGLIKKLEFTGKPGIGKFTSAILHLSKFLEEKDLAWATPWLVPLIQTSVRIMYQSYFEEWFDKHGLEDSLETLVGFELSSPEPAATPPPASGMDDLFSES